MPINVVHTKPEFTDERGYITRLINDDTKQFKDVLYITSKAGTERGNHYHKADYHYVYCVGGKFRYSEKDMSNPNSTVESVVLEPGDIVLSNKMIAHSMKFLEDTVFLAITTEPREQNKYEEDTVRIKITPDEK